MKNTIKFKSFIPLLKYAFLPIRFAQTGNYNICFT